MSDDTLKTRKIGVTFQRKLSDGNYGGTEASAWVEGNVPDDAGAQAVAEALANLYASAKAAVLDELGIEWAIDPDTGAITEKSVPQVQQIQTPKPHGGGGTPQQSGDGVVDGVRIMNYTGQDIDQWAINSAKRDGIGAIWDNRATAQASDKNLPWYKEAVARGAVGHGKDGQAKGWWPPKQ
jgi:hypothetical protein